MKLYRYLREQHVTSRSLRYLVRGEHRMRNDGWAIRSPEWQRQKALIETLRARLGASRQNVAA